jgi:hypothetical protein
LPYTTTTTVDVLLFEMALPNMPKVKSNQLYYNIQFTTSHVEFGFSIGIKDHNFVCIAPNGRIDQCKPMECMLLQATSHDW